jgi:hypothetical protein
VEVDIAHDLVSCSVNWLPNSPSISFEIFVA